QTTGSQILHKRRNTKHPDPCVHRRIDTVLQTSELRCIYTNNITDLMPETTTSDIAVLRRRKHCPKHQHKPIRIMVLTEGLTHQLERVTADLSHRRASSQLIPFRPVNLEIKHGRTHIINREAVVKKADKRPKGTGRIIVLGLTEQQCRTPLKAT